MFRLSLKNIFITFFIVSSFSCRARTLPNQLHGEVTDERLTAGKDLEHISKTLLLQQNRQTDIALIQENGKMIYR